MHIYQIAGMTFNFDAYVLRDRCMPLGECQNYLRKHGLPDNYDTISAMHRANRQWAYVDVRRFADECLVDTLSDQDQLILSNALFQYVNTLREEAVVIVPADITAKVSARRRLGL